MWLDGETFGRSPQVSFLMDKSDQLLSFTFQTLRSILALLIKTLNYLAIDLLEPMPWIVSSISKSKSEHNSSIFLLDSGVQILLLNELKK